MSQEPWNEEVYHTTASRKDRLSSSLASTKVFTVLAVLFFIIVLVVSMIAIYLSVGGSQTDSTKEFFNASVTPLPSSSEPAPEEPVEETTPSSSISQTTEDATLTVQAGEGLGALAARGGISISELERLNPEKMVTGSWLAHPGDVVRIR